ncbi:S9 family peptidase [Paracidovorax valerianellae]|uniref:Dipeptidyl aminopeptidase/acylaminoacyl peptidase n=1 Tax=Paracidovorax valerianellae TaxID=187868 RepID=A0A1G6YND8_9BURK|nr:S9 family peptidase [Paracidovorax valerianellae]MDA8447385.1 S9 family peptidase [Paracidovorax valerianellae]SDD91822.1 Dipeptidyl aminopeptidase/acylaminoacyl peptidase [Paracidovorax valerianellae]
MSMKQEDSLRHPAAQPLTPGAGSTPPQESAAPAPAAQKKPFLVDDLYLHQKLTDLHCTPHGQLAACVVQSVDRENDTYVSCLWAFALDGSGVRQLTRGPGSDTAPRWSPDGQQLAFLSSRTGAPQVHVLPRDGGEARQVTHLPQGASSVRWTPDGKAMVVAAGVAVDPELRGERSDQPALARPANAPEVAWRLPYKSDGLGYLLSREIHLFHVDAATGVHRQVTDGAFEVMAHDISPDGERIAYVRTRSGRFAHAADLWVCQADGSGYRRLTHGHAMVMQPAWSPDGSHIAFAGSVEEGDAASRLWLAHATSGEVRPLGEVEVADPASLHWTQDGSAIVFVRAHRGRHQIARIAVAGEGRLEVLVGGDHQIGVFGHTGEHLAFSAEHPSLASELRVAGPEGQGARQISQLNAWWNERTVVQAEARLFEVPDAQDGTERIEGWLLRAEGAQGPMPLLNDIHGGPASYALLDFDTNVYWQVLCARGWAVLALNAVGSSSYGQAFCRRLAGQWGDADLPQHLAAIEQLKAEGVCDDRVAVCGKSYGGYLTAWATGHTDRFRAAVVMAPVGNIETHYGTSDGGYYADPFYLATAPHFDRRRARELSPLQYVERSKTPTLFLQGKEDERCPKCQSEELFVSLLRAGDTPAELVLYPGEGHGFLGSGAPSCRADAARRIVGWIEQHCGTGETPSKAPGDIG